MCVFIFEHFNHTQVPSLCEDLLSSVDQPLKIARDKETGKDYLLCDYNRDGDSYRYILYKYEHLILIRHFRRYTHVYNYVHVKYFYKKLVM